MSIPQKPNLTTPPAAPQRTDPPTTFSSKADAYVTWQSGYRNELADAIDWQNTVFTATETEATNAADSATAAADSATASATARDKSQEWAENPEDVEVEAGQYSALHHAAKAEGYKDTAETAAAAAQSAAGLPSLVGQAGNSLKVNGTEDGVEWGAGLISEYQEFTASGTWSKDPNAQWVYVEIVNGGQGGGVLRGPSGTTPDAGDGGTWMSILSRAADLPASVSVIVGSGGSSQTLGPGDSNVLVPTPGGASSFNGIGPTQMDSDLQPANAFNGCQANRSATVFRTIYGGAGGSGQTKDGFPGGVSVYHGDGGSAAYSYRTDGTYQAGNGGFPGGGGGAAIAYYNAVGDNITVISGAGGDGVVRVWQW